MVPVKIKEEIQEITIFSINFEPMISYNNSKLRMQTLNNIKKDLAEQIPNPVITGSNVMTIEKPTAEEKVYKEGDYTITAKQVKVFKVSADKKLLLTFLNNGLRRVMNKLDFVEIGRSSKYFNCKNKTNIDNLIMFDGYKANFISLEAGYYLRIEPAKKIVRNETVMHFIDKLYLTHKDEPKE